MTDLRILMLLENAPYPADSRVRPESLTLRRAGYQVSVICPADPGQPWHEELEGVHVYRYPVKASLNERLGHAWEYSYAMIATFLLSILVFFRQGFDVLHAHNPPDTFVFIAAFYKLFGRRFVYDQHDIVPELYHARSGGRGNEFMYRLLCRLERFSFRLADQVIVANESSRRRALARGLVAETAVTVVRNGPDPNLLWASEPLAEVRQKARIIIGYAGVLGFQDGVDYLLRALNHLVQDLDRRDFHCLIIGEGVALADLRRLTCELDLTSYVTFTGWLSGADYVAHLSTADICVDPDPSNAYNDYCTMIKMMEYMALSRPIVAFDLPEHRFTAREAAVYVPGNDEMAFAQAISELMDDPLRRCRMGSLGRRRIEQKLAWSYSAQNLLAAYERLSPILAQA